MNKIVILFFFLLGNLMVGFCQMTKESNAMMLKAHEVYLNFGLETPVRVDSSLKLTIRALELDVKNVSALEHKSTILLIKKDINGLLENVDKLLAISPKHAQRLGHKGLYLALKGDVKGANMYYQKSIALSRENLKVDSLNFKLLIDYVSTLALSGDTVTAKLALDRMENMPLNDTEKIFLDLLRSELNIKERMFKYWKGEITYNQMAGEPEEIQALPANDDAFRDAP